jgi:glycosyltransferase involved in cell wall biosynthesis
MTISIIHGIELKMILMFRSRSINILVIWLSHAASMEKAALGAKSGGDTHILELSKKGDLLGHKVVMLTSNSGKLLLHAECGRLELHQVSIPFESYLLLKGRLGVGVLHALRPLRALFVKSKRRIDVIVAPSHYPVDVLSALFLHLRNPKSKIVVYLHGIFPEIPRKRLLLRTSSLLYNYFGFLILKMVADLIFVFNKHTWNFLLIAGLDHKKVFLTSNGVDVTNLNIVEDEKLFDACFLGRLAYNKGIPDLVKAWKLVCKLRKDAKIAVIGSGPEDKLLNELVVTEGLRNNIILFGFVSERRKHEILQSSKIFVFPSWMEGWGIAVAEAMACGLPVVAYNLPVYKEVFEDKLVTVPVGDADAMVERVVFLLENPEVARTIGEAGREFIKRYDWSQVAEKELSAILEMVTPLYH